MEIAMDEVSDAVQGWLNAVGLTMARFVPFLLSNTNCSGVTSGRVMCE
jgi:hypothetical protein